MKIIIKSETGSSAFLGGLLLLCAAMILFRSAHALAAASSPDHLDVGAIFQECEHCPQMIIIPSGVFRMGDLHGTGQADEQPVRPVMMPRPFGMSRFEVTVREFTAFVEATGYKTGDQCWTYEDRKFERRAGRNWRQAGYPLSALYPVSCVSWQDAQAYVAWLSHVTEADYRLPSEAEWEYAARANGKASFSWGSGAPSCSRAEVTGAANGYCTPVGPRQIGSFRANDFGLFDMHGNMWEWVQDCWNDSYDGAPVDGKAWTEGNCFVPVLRGGSWASSPGNLRSALRNRLRRDGRNNSVGFRVVRTISDPKISLSLKLVLASR